MTCPGEGEHLAACTRMGTGAATLPAPCCQSKTGRGGAQHEPTHTARRPLEHVVQHKHLLSGIIQEALWKGGSCSTGLWQGLKGSQWHSDTAGSVPGCLRAAGESTVPVNDISPGLRVDTGERTSRSHLSPCSKCQAGNSLEQMRGTRAQCLLAPRELY